MSPRILLWDCETLPHVLWNFGNRMEWMRPGQVIRPSRTIMFGAKWYGEKSAVVHAEWDDSHEEMAKHLFALYDEADIIVAYNGDRFDDKKAKTLFEQYGLGRPSPYKTVDPFKVAKKHLDLPSYKLDEVLKFYGLPEKIKTDESLWTTLLWADMGLDVDEKRALDARKKMARYQKQDVLVLESLWDRIRPYLPALPGVEGPGKCDRCFSTHLQRRGFQTTLTAKYVRYQCQDCGAWMQDRHAESTTDIKGIS